MTILLIQWTYLNCAKEKIIMTIVSIGKEVLFKSICDGCQDNYDKWERVGSMTNKTRKNRDLQPMSRVWSQQRVNKREHQG